jgi:hypothetical protein
MGGHGSGKWERLKARLPAVEESVRFSIQEIHAQIVDGASGVFAAELPRRHVGLLGYRVTVGDRATIDLLYRSPGSEDVRTVVRLQTSQPRFGGQRWWLTCPMTRNGTSCNRRVGYLYLPPGASDFGCRKCHDLTYRSCQMAHSEERREGFFGRMQRRLEGKRKRHGISDEF